jgi:hypothetical protein
MGGDAGSSSDGGGSGGAASVGAAANDDAWHKSVMVASMLYVCCSPPFEVWTVPKAGWFAPQQPTDLAAASTVGGAGAVAGAGAGGTAGRGNEGAIGTRAMLPYVLQLCTLNALITEHPAVHSSTTAATIAAITARLVPVEGHLLGSTLEAVGVMLIVALVKEADATLVAGGAIPDTHANANANANAGAGAGAGAGGDAVDATTDEASHSMAPTPTAVADWTIALTTVCASLGFGWAYKAVITAQLWPLLGRWGSTLQPAAPAPAKAGGGIVGASADNSSTGASAGSGCAGISAGGGSAGAASVGVALANGNTNLNANAAAAAAGGAGAGAGSGSDIELKRRRANVFASVFHLLGSIGLRGMGSNAGATAGTQAIAAAVDGVLQQHIAGTITVQMPVCAAVASTLIAFANITKEGGEAGTVASWIENMAPETVQQLPDDLKAWWSSR